MNAIPTAIRSIDVRLSANPYPILKIGRAHV